MVLSTILIICRTPRDNAVEAHDVLKLAGSLAYVLLATVKVDDIVCIHVINTLELIKYLYNFTQHI